MYIMIEIVYPLSEENVEAAIEHYFKATGNLLIGRRIFDETGEVLLVVLVFAALAVSADLQGVASGGNPAV